MIQCSIAISANFFLLATHYNIILNMVYHSKTNYVLTFSIKRLQSYKLLPQVSLKCDTVGGTYVSGMNLQYKSLMKDDTIDI